MTAVPFAGSPRRALLEGVIILAVLVLLASSVELRTLVKAQPRSTIAALAIVLGVWLHSQIRQEPRHTFPLVSWWMYGQSRFEEDLISYDMILWSDDGSVPYPMHVLGVAHGLENRIQTRYERLEALGNQPGAEAAAALLDELLLSLLEIARERRGADYRSLSLERLVVPAELVGDSSIPPATEVRRVDLD